MKLPGPGTIYLKQDLRFLKPVLLGDTVTARVEIVEILREKQRVRLRTTCLNQESQLVLEGEALVLEVRGVVAVAGDGPLAAELQAAAPGVRWLGARDDVADLLIAADVVVLPSVWEARSLTAQEALRAGRPLVATAVGGLPALVGDGAVLVPPGDAVALGLAVRRLLDDPAAAAAVAARGRAVAASWPTEQDTVNQVAALYAELLG